jgi:hypothetical protein
MVLSVCDCFVLFCVCCAKATFNEEGAKGWGASGEVELKYLFATRKRKVRHATISALVNDTSPLQITLPGGFVQGDDPKTRI